MISLSVMKIKIAIVVPNWNGKDTLGDCLDSLLNQSYPAKIIVVENGSTDGSAEFLKENYPTVTTLPQPKNLGFAGGVNVGIRYSLEQKYNAIALFNNDAVADKEWLKHLVSELDSHSEAGIVTCKLLKSDKKHIDSTGDLYTTWGLPYPRGRDETKLDKYDDSVEVFGASGGASLYRASMLKEIGLFDEDFFAYYEDVDISFRAQLAGWKVRYTPKSVAYHQQGLTSSKIKGFTTYQTFKNFPWLFWKNVPGKLVFSIFWRFTVAYTSIFISTIINGRGWYAIKGLLTALWLLPKKLGQRRTIQQQRKVPIEYIDSILVRDLPPNADKLRKLRSFFSRS